MTLALLCYTWSFYGRNMGFYCLSCPSSVLFDAPFLCVSQICNKGIVYTLSSRVRRYVRQQSTLSASTPKVFNLLRLVSKHLEHSNSPTLHYKMIVESPDRCIQIELYMAQMFIVRAVLRDWRGIDHDMCSQRSRVM